MARKKEEDVEENSSEKAGKKKEKKPASRIQQILASELFDKMRKKHGKLIITAASDARVAKSFRIPSGVFPLDKALGGGWPQGRINVIYGMKSSCKTTLLLKTLAEVQHMCSNCWEYVQWTKLTDVEVEEAPEEVIDEATGEVTIAKKKGKKGKKASEATVDGEGTVVPEKKFKKEWLPVTGSVRWYPANDTGKWKELFRIETNKEDGTQVPVMGEEMRPLCGCSKYREAVAAFIDVEGTFDKRWAVRQGIDLDKLLLIVPEYAEQSLDMADALVRSGDCDVIVLDSIAFLTPAKEIEESTDKQTMGGAAKIINLGVRKFVSGLNMCALHSERRPTIFLTNQIRMKIGVVFGCFHGETPVMFADGSQHPISEVVNQELEGPVLSWDGTRIVERKIVQWFNNGPLQPEERWLTFRVEGTHGRRGAQGFTCTPNHVLVSGEGREVRAVEVRPGDTLTSWYEATLSPTELEVVTGSLFGDGHITEKGSLSFTNAEQPEYLQWKLRLFRSLGFTSVSSHDRTAWRSSNSFELRQIRDAFYGAPDQTQPGKNYRTVPLSLLRAASTLTLAVWYADDGSYKETHRSACISVKRLTPGHARAVAAALAERYPGVNYNESQQAVLFPTETFEKFSGDIARYLPPCMAYKLLPEHRNSAIGAVISEPSMLRRVPCQVEVKSVRISKKKHRSPTKYDLQIEGDSFYLVGGDSAGVVVHNSPETQPGGMAPGFAASVEVKTKPGRYEFDKSDEDHPIPIEVEIPFDIDKNKSSVPKMSGAFKMALIDGTTKKLGDVYDEDEVLAEAVSAGIVTKEGSRWTCLGVPYDSKSLIDKRLRLDQSFNRSVRHTLLKLMSEPVVDLGLQPEPSLEGLEAPPEALALSEGLGSLTGDDSSPEPQDAA